MAVTSEKRKTFNREFREARQSFRANPIEKNFTFTSKVDGGKKTVLKEGETKQGLMKKFKSESNADKPAASAKPANSMPGYLKRKVAGKKRIVKNPKLADVTKQELDSWKTKNKGFYKGKALTAYLNAKGKNLSSASSPVELSSKNNILSKTKKLDTTGPRITSQSALKFFRNLDPTYKGKIELGDQVILGTVKGESKIIEVLKMTAQKGNNNLKTKPMRSILNTSEKNKLIKTLTENIRKQKNRTDATRLITQYNVRVRGFANVPTISETKRKQLLDKIFKK